VIAGYSWRNMITKKYLERYIHADNNHIEKYGTGKLISMIEWWIKDRSTLLEQTIVRGLEFLITVILSIWMVMQYHRWYGFIFVGMLAWVHGAVLRLNGKAVSERRFQVVALQNYTARLTKIIMSKIEIFQRRRLDHESSILSWYIDDVIASNKKRSTIAFIMFQLPLFLLDLARLGILSFAGFHIIQSAPWYTYSQLVVILSLLGVMYSLLDSSITFFKDFTKNFYTVERVRDTFDSIPTIQGYDQWQLFAYQWGNVAFHDVTFSYTQTDVLQKLSLEIVGGKKTALVGASGSGKSTIIKLIAGYLYPSAWYIAVDWQRLPSYQPAEDAISLQSYYQHIWFLTQEPSVFDGTVRENLAYSLDHDLSDEQRHNPHWAVFKALASAQCDFIHEMPDGIDTQIGEKGIRLSGGQRQRLAIAKIFLQNPSIILLDEPTAALDSFSEEKISQALHTLFVWRTVVVIAHRLQTVRHADDIIVLDSGTIIERWTHDQLVAAGGQYAKMLELQSWF
jgi:ABC-type multidrug transport system fused ATPase/permease subunit